MYLAIGWYWVARGGGGAFERHVHLRFVYTSYWLWNMYPDDHQYVSAHLRVSLPSVFEARADVGAPALDESSRMECHIDG